GEPAPEVVLNYLGRFAALRGGWSPLDGDAFGVFEPDGMALGQVLALNVFVHERDQPRLAVEWTAASQVLDADAVAGLREHWELALEALAAHAARGAGGLSP